MTTESELIPIERDLDELLKLDTYQGMTDAEIKKLMEYKELIAATNARTEALAEEMEAKVNVINEQAAKALEQSQANFEKACAMIPEFKTVEDVGE